MSKRLFLFFFFVCLHSFLHAAKTFYDLSDDPIDVVIVSHPKDKETLHYCISGIRKNCNKVRRVIVVSSERLSKKCEWFDEKNFPFSKDDVANVIARGDKNKIKEFFDSHRNPGWYYQQLLKLYSPFVIPGISSNVLIIDADTIFMNPVEFLNEKNGGLFCVAKQEPQKGYFKHAEQLVPGYKRIYPEYYSVCHHMLFQRPILEDLFHTVEQYHKTDFWIAFCSCVDLQKNRGASEYEIYYNFALNHSDQVALRPLKWRNSGFLERREEYKKEGFHFVSFHTYMRGKQLPRTKSKQDKVEIETSSPLAG